MASKFMVTGGGHGDIPENPSAQIVCSCGDRVLGGVDYHNMNALEIDNGLHTGNGGETYFYIDPDGVDYNTVVQNPSSVEFDIVRGKAFYNGAAVGERVHVLVEKSTLTLTIGRVRTIFRGAFFIRYFD